jgi:polyhydroxybutyrate depolymerase
MKETISFLLSFCISKSQVLTDSVFIENNYRVFHFYTPKSATKDFNLVFALHGSGGDGNGMMKPAAKLQEMSGKEPLFLVYPDGYKRYWNECRKSATSIANIENINEQAFFEAMHQYFIRKYAVNKKRFFAIGLSGGGHMAYKLAMTMPGKCKAITAVVANLPDTDNLDCAESKMAVSVLIINGTKDATDPYGGGEMKVNGSSFGRVRSSENSFNYWARLAGYKGAPAIEELPDTNTGNEQTITRYRFKERGKPEVTLLKVVGGEHNFPADVDAFIEAWAFFKRSINEKAIK